MLAVGIAAAPQELHIVGAVVRAYGSTALSTTPLRWSLRVRPTSVSRRRQPSAHHGDGCASSVKCLRDLPALYKLATAVACPSLVEGLGCRAELCSVAVGRLLRYPCAEGSGGGGSVRRPLNIGMWAATLRRLLADSILREKLTRRMHELTSSVGGARLPVCCRFMRDCGLGIRG